MLVIFTKSRRKKRKRKSFDTGCTPVNIRAHIMESPKTPAHA
jgi:hypothetical protein